MDPRKELLIKILKGYQNIEDVGMRRIGCIEALLGYINDGDVDAAYRYAMAPQEEGAGVEQ